MKKRTLVSIVSAGLAGALFIASPVFAHSSHHRGGYVGRDYSYGAPVGHGYDRGWRMGHGHPYSGYGGREYTRFPYSGYGSNYGPYDHPAGTRGYRGKDARHHRRGHQHHHGR